MKEKEIIKLTDRYILPTYKRNRVVFVRGKGANIQDVNGKRYIDFFSGLAVNNLGHCHTNIVKAIQEQASRLMHTSNLYYTRPQAILAEKLVKMAFPGKVFFCNSGAEANEAAIKLVRKWGNPERNEIITMKGSFHGRTITTLTATGQTKYQKGFQPLAYGFKYAPFNDLKSVEKLITKRTVAIMIEPIQGEGGINIASMEFINGLRQLCNEKRILLIFDEVQTGIGRTGKMFCYEHYGIKPDILTLAKALGGGLPIGAMIADQKLVNVFKPGTHASTFGGNPVVCAAACAVLDTIAKEGLLENAARMGNYLLDKLQMMKYRYNSIKDVRGRGLMIGVEMKFKGKKIVEKCLKNGLLLNCTAERVIRFLPPLTITGKEIDIALQIFEEAIKK